MTDLVVTDASCLIALDRVGHLDVLPALFDVLAPSAVAKEFGRRYPWLRVVDVPGDSVLGDLLAVLDRGEAEAVALAVARSEAGLLIDEHKGRRVAREMGLTITGTAGVLLLAKRAELIAAVEPVLTALVQDHSFRLAPRHVEAVLRQAGER